MRPVGQKGPDYGPSREVSSIERSLQGLSTDELLARYHELIDRRLTGNLELVESFELGRIESRLNAEDEDGLRQLADYKKQWQRERKELVANIEGLLARLKSTE